MIFNSLDFAIFLPIVFAIYWLIPSYQVKIRNLLILIASYVFYGWWDWRFLSLIVFSSLLDYSLAINMEKSSNPKYLLYLSLFCNLALLGFFKYYNFFLESFIDTFSFFGYNLSVTHLEIILPVGISFYTFQTLSYSIDVYRKVIPPSKNIISFSLKITTI